MVLHPSQIFAGFLMTAHAATDRAVSVSSYRGKAAINAIRFLTVIPRYASPIVLAACPQIASTVRLSSPRVVGMGFEV